MATIRGGDKLAAALKSLSEKVSKASSVRVGFLEGATYPDGTPVAMVAAIQNYGAPKVGIPPRPFFSGMVADKSPEWPAAIGQLLVENDYDSQKTLELAGEAIEGQLKEAIIETNAPALSPVTVMLRGMKSHDQSLVVTGKTVGEAAARVKAGLTNYGASTKVLDETGHMLDSTGHEVRS
jgi:hypothetical protein